MAFFNSGRINPSQDRVHDHSAQAQDGDTLNPRLVQVSQQVQVGNAIPATALTTLLGNDGTIEAGLSVYTPGLELEAVGSVTDTGTKNNYAPQTSWGAINQVIFNPGAALTITGLDAAPGGVTFGQAVAVLVNINGTNSITLKHASTSSSAANRITCPNAVDFTIAPFSAAILYRDTQNSRWRVLAVPGSSALADHAHSASGDGGSTLTPAVVTVAGLLENSDVIDLGAISAAVNDAAIGTVGVVRATPTGGARNLTGMVAAASWQQVQIINDSASFGINIPHDSASSSAANRFYCASAATFNLPPLASVMTIYDPTAARWRVLGK